MDNLESKKNIATEEEESLFQSLIVIFRRYLVVFLIAFITLSPIFLYFNYKRYKDTPFSYRVKFKLELKPKLVKADRILQPQKEQAAEQIEYYTLEEDYGLQEFVEFVNDEFFFRGLAKRVYKDKVEESNVGRFIGKLQGSIRIYPSLKEIVKEKIKRERVVTVSIDDVDPDEAFRISEEWILFAEKEKINSERKVLSNKIEVLERQLQEETLRKNEEGNQLNRLVEENEVLQKIIKDGRVIIDPEAISSKPLGLKKKATKLDIFISEIKNYQSKGNYLAGFEFLFSGGTDSLDVNRIKATINISPRFLSEYKEKLNILDDLLRINTEFHPDVVKAKEDISYQEKIMATELGKAIELLNRDKEEIIKDIQYWNSLIVDGGVQAIASYDNLKNNMSILDKKIGVLNSEIKNLEMTKKLISGTLFSILEDPIKPTRPYNIEDREKKKTRGIAMSFLMAGFLSFGLIWFLDSIDLNVKDVETIENLGWVVLGDIPYSKEIVKKETDKLDIYKGQHHFIETIDHLRTNIEFSIEDNKKVISVISSMPGEGKTFVAVNVAALLARSGKKTLLIESDLRRPQFNKYFDVDTHAKGLKEMLEGEDVKPVKCFIDNLWVMPAGGKSTNPGRILGFQRLKDFINIWKKDFEWLIFDSPPINVVGDAVLIAKSTDYVIPVVFIHKTPRVLLKRVKEVLTNLGISVLGVAFNGVKVKKRYGYGGYYDGQHYYSQK